MLENQDWQVEYRGGRDETGSWAFIAGDSSTWLIGDRELFWYRVD